jgi:hypothetical protein
LFIVWTLGGVGLLRQEVPKCSLTVALMEMLAMPDIIGCHPNVMPGAKLCQSARPVVA